MESRIEAVQTRSCIASHVLHNVVDLLQIGNRQGVIVIDKYLIRYGFELIIVRAAMSTLQIVRGKIFSEIKSQGICQLIRCGGGGSILFLFSPQS